MRERRGTKQRDPFEFLIEESKKGRAIIPFLGAGVSAEVGFPPLSLLTEYLAKVQGYLHRGLFRLTDWSQLASFEPIPRSETPGTRSLLKGKDLWDGLYRVGWPDPNQLHSDLWHYLGYSTEPEESNSARGGPFARRLERLVLLEVLRGLSARDSQFVKSAAPGLLDALRDPRAQPDTWRASGAYWRDLLGTLTRADRDLIDALFQMLTARRRPGLAHRYLALLAPVLRLRLFFTINFDPFLERALHVEGLSPEVFRVSELDPLPHPSLVRESLAVLKLHGSGHGLRVGESLNAPIDRETGSRFEEYLPAQPILLIMGVGAADGRILDLIGRIPGQGVEGEVLWLHFEPDGPPDPVMERFGEDGELPSWLYHHRVRHPGAFLGELYLRYRGGHPPSRFGYRPYPPRPIPTSPPAERRGTAEPASDRPRVNRPPPPLRIFRGSRGERGFGATAELADFVAELSETHQPIWIDLDTLSRIPELVSELLKQLRTYDPALPPENLTYTTGQDDLRKAARRIVAALGRGRYVVAFNGVEAFGRDPLEHHDEGRRDATSQKFLLALIQKAFEKPPDRSAGQHRCESAYRLRDSVLAFSFQSTNRKPRGWNKQIAVAADLTGLPRNDLERKIDGMLPDEAILYPEGLLEENFDDWELLASLSAFRRWRSLAFLADLKTQRNGSHTPILDRYGGLEVGARRAFERLLARPDRASVRQVLRNLEGGFLWISRPLRDVLFQRLFERKLAEPEPETRRLAGLVRIQRKIAQHYFRGLYQTSRDPWMLYEHLYHRVETIRRVRQLHEQLQANPPSKVLGQEVWKLISVDKKKGKGKEDADFEAPLKERVADQWRKEYRALVGVLGQERERLHAGLPGPALASWSGACAVELRKLKPESRLPREPREDFEKLERKGLQVLNSLLLAVYRDGLDTGMQVAQLQKWMKALVSSRPQAIRIAKQACDPERGAEALLHQIRDRDAAASMERTSSIIDCLAEAADGLRRIGRVDKSKPIADEIRRRLESWQRPGEDRGSGEDEEGTAERYRVRREFGFAAYHRLHADLALMNLDPWDAKCRGLHPKREFEAKAKEAQDEAACALGFLDYLPERDYLERAYLHSLEGRAYTLLKEYEKAYRSFDLARAVLSRRGTSPSPPEALVATYLRNAECFILDADRSQDDTDKRGRDRRLAGIEARLAKASEVLDQAEACLEQGGRAADWWACLFQLRAQLEVERLLAIVLQGEPVVQEGAAPGSSTKGSGDESRGPSDRSTRIGRATRAVRRGLNAVRRGLDVLSPHDRVRPRRFVRLWLELLVASVHARAQLSTELSVKQNGQKPLTGADRARFLCDCLEVWELGNHQAGLERLSRSEEPCAWVRELAAEERFPKREGECGAYANVKERIAEVLEKKLDDDPMTKLTSDAAYGGSPG